MVIVIISIFRLLIMASSLPEVSQHIMEGMSHIDYWVPRSLTLSRYNSPSLSSSLPSFTILLCLLQLLFLFVCLFVCIVPQREMFLWLCVKLEWYARLPAKWLNLQQQVKYLFNAFALSLSFGSPLVNSFSSWLNASPRKNWTLLVAVDHHGCIDGDGVPESLRRFSFSGIARSHYWRHH